MADWQRAGRALAGCVLLTFAMATQPQEPPDAQMPRGRPVNLQVLQQDLPAAHLGRLMKRYERDLGVSCSYCHVENRDNGKLDYVSDDNPKKQIARIMIAMVNDINDRHLEQLGGDRRYAVPVTCGSCHQGRANPQAFEGRRP